RLVRLFRGVRFEHSESACVVCDLTLEVRYLHAVVVDHADGPHACLSKIVSDWRAEAPSTHKRHLGIQNLLLSIAADFRDQYMSAVSQYLIFCKIHGNLSTQPHFPSYLGRS